MCGCGDRKQWAIEVPELPFDSRESLLTLRKSNVRRKSAPAKSKAAPKVTNTTGKLPEWNLADLYSGIDAPEVARDLSKMDADCVAFGHNAAGHAAPGFSHFQHPDGPDGDDHTTAIGMAGGMLGVDVAAKSAPDGYTLLLMSNAHTVNETLIPNKPFNLTRDFVGVAPINYSDLVLVAHPSVPAQNLAEALHCGARDCKAGTVWDGTKCTAECAPVSAGH